MTLKIQLLSDLHLEVHPHFVPTPAPGADLLVLAGDVGSYQPGSLLKDDDFGLARFSPQQGWPTPVLYTPGNHEYDGLDFDATHARLRQTCERLGLTWLERETVTLQQLTGADGRNGPDAPAVRFVGTTLWTDFDALGPRGVLSATSSASSTSANALAQQLKARDKAFRAANFYLKKALTTRHGEPMLAAQMRDQALVCQSWLRAALNEPFDGTTVAITHFAPSLKSADPRYGMTPGTAGFCNALDELLPLAQLWLHGHLHAPSDYVADGCRVVANPLGYARKNEQNRFQGASTVNLPVK
jgi:Calcineurin-like phosphoesterase